MASNTTAIEPTKPMSDAQGLRPAVDRAADGRLLRKLIATRPAAAMIASDSSTAGRIETLKST